MNEIEPRKCWSQRLTHSQIIKVKKKEVKFTHKEIKNINF